MIFGIGQQFTGRASRIVELSTLSGPSGNLVDLGVLAGDWGITINNGATPATASGNWTSIVNDSSHSMRTWAKQMTAADIAGPVTNAYACVFYRGVKSVGSLTAGSASVTPITITGIIPSNNCVGLFIGMAQSWGSPPSAPPTITSPTGFNQIHNWSSSSTSWTGYDRPVVYRGGNIIATYDDSSGGSLFGRVIGLYG